MEGEWWNQLTALAQKTSVSKNEIIRYSRKKSSIFILFLLSSGLRLGERQVELGRNERGNEEKWKID